MKTKTLIIASFLIASQPTQTMKLHTLTAIFAAALLSTLPSQAQTPEQKPQPPNAPAIPISKNVTIRATIVALKNVEATAFSAKQDLSGKPAEALDTLEKLVAQQKAHSVANVRVTTKSGQRALSDSGKTMTDYIFVRVFLNDATPNHAMELTASTRHAMCYRPTGTWRAALWL